MSTHTLQWYTSLAHLQLCTCHHTCSVVCALHICSHPCAHVPLTPVVDFPCTPIVAYMPLQWYTCLTHLQWCTCHTCSGVCLARLQLHTCHPRLQWYTHLAHLQLHTSPNTCSGIWLAHLQPDTCRMCVCVCAYMYAVIQMHGGSFQGWLPVWTKQGLQIETGGRGRREEANLEGRNSGSGRLGDSG